MRKHDLYNDPNKPALVSWLKKTAQIKNLKVKLHDQEQFKWLDMQYQCPEVPKAIVHGYLHPQKIVLSLLSLTVFNLWILNLCFELGYSNIYSCSNMSEKIK